ncbi:TonB-dependent receptor [Solilutibacter silvestris]|uniref:TonB dependent receptor n=1 Tax=Solilutibacter silvestris TaxID=1645665 RepID=A0A2K1PZ60_9GAMM|nr:TonB-dependent receptor [Lysobacter silvestris]PNS08059.1 TonB dependent receptor [Lysobacter silvestris]
MRRIHRHAPLCLAIAIGLAAPLAQAQDATAQSTPATKPAQAAKQTADGDLGAITVTARRREETLQEVPVAVTAFTAKALEKLNVQDLGDLKGQVPNLTIYAARGSNTTLTAYIRGVGQSDPLWGVDPGVGMYIDDVYVARPQGAMLDLLDVGRIEVLRGPQGTLYGKNTIGGAIKYITKPLATDFNGFVQGTVGNYNERDVKLAVGDAFGDAKALRARLSMAKLTRDGFGKNLTSGNDVSDKDIFAWRLAVGAYVTDKFDLQFAYDHTDDESGVRGAQMLAKNPFAPTYAPMASRYDVRNGMPDVNHTKLDGLSMTANWRLNDAWAAKYIWAKRQSNTETNIDFDTLPNKLADVKAFYRDHQTSNELQANYDAGGRARGVMGIYQFEGDAGGQVLNNFFNLLFGDTHGTVYTKSVALYADWTFDLTSKLKLDAGVRYTDEKKHAVVRNISYTDATFSKPNGAVAADFDKNIGFKNVSPKVSLDYQITPGVMVYGLASRGFKSGGYNIRANATAVPRTAEPFQDERVDSMEVGSKMALADQTLFLNMAYFHNKYKNIQLSVFTEYTTPGGAKAFIGDFTNAGSGTVNGFEFEYQWLPSKHFALTGNLAWLDAKFDEYMYKNVNIAAQQAFTNAPKFSGAINAEYRTSLGAAGELSARVSYTRQSSVVATTEVTHDPVTGVNTQPIEQGAYGLIGAGVIWKPSKPWTVSLQGSNLNNSKYLTTGYVIPSLGVRTGFYGAPRQYTLSLRYDF